MKYRASPQSLQEVRNFIEELEHHWRLLREVSDGANILESTASHLSVKAGDPNMATHLSHACAHLRQTTSGVREVIGHSMHHYRLLIKCFEDSLRDESFQP